MKHASRIAFAAALIIAAGLTLGGNPARAAAAHEARTPVHGAALRYREADPPSRVALRYGCTIDGTYLGEPYCFGGEALRAVELQSTRNGGSRAIY